MFLSVQRKHRKDKKEITPGDGWEQGGRDGGVGTGNGGVILLRVYLFE